MLSNYLTVAFRNLVKYKVYSFVNIGGLSIGLAACLAIGLYVRDECGHDRFHRYFDDLYRVVETQKQADGLHPVAVTPGPLAPSLERDFPEIVQATRVGRWPALLQTGGKGIETKSTLIVDNTFLKMFDFKLIQGDLKTALTNPDEIILSETLAGQLFGGDWRNSSIMGKNILLNTEFPTTIVGVVENAPANSHLQFDALMPFKSLEKYDAWSNKWNSNNFHTYLQLKPETDAAAFGTKIERQIAKYDNNNDAALRLQPLRDIYLYSKFDFETDWGKRNDVFFVRIFLAIGLIILLTAMVNFVNLATARASQRAREVGIRKSVGARRHSLVAQFLGESLLMTTLAVTLALLMGQPAIALFELLVDKHLAIPFHEPNFWLLIVGVTVVVGLFTGGYPAIFLS